MNAYDTLTALTDSTDIVIPMKLSTFCAMFDLKQTPTIRQKMLADMVAWVKENPKGI